MRQSQWRQNVDISKYLEKQVRTFYFHKEIHTDFILKGTVDYSESILK